MTITYFDHQEKAIEEILPEHDRFCLFWEMGTGKTLPILVHLDNLIMLGEVHKALWVGPLSAYGVVDKGIEMLPKRRQKRIREVLTVINYDKLSRKTSKAAEEVSLTDWDFIILDEAHKIARPKSNRTKFFVGSGKTCGMAKCAKYRYILTGTPVNQSRYEDFWSYMRFLLDDDYMPYSDFKAKYLKMKNYPPGTYNYIVAGYKKKVEELKETVSRFAWYLKTEDCQDLPEQLPDNIIKIPWTPKAKKIYTEALESYVDELDMVMDNPLSKMTKLRQIASGHVKDDMGNVLELSKAKAQAACDIVEGCDKCVIFFDYRCTRDMIIKELKKLNISYVTLDGEQKDKTIWKKFQQDDSIRVILAQYQSGSESVDLFAANVTIFAEPCLSSSLMEQARKRIHRQGQTRACMYYYLLADGSIDEDIYDRLCSHKDFSEKLYREIARKTLERIKQK